MVLKIGIIDGENTSQYTGSFSGSFTGSLSDSGLDLQEITDEGNITTNMVRASGLQSLEKAAVSISASAGWYRVLKFNSNNNEAIMILIMVIITMLTSRQRILKTYSW